MMGLIEVRDALKIEIALFHYVFPADINSMNTALLKRFTLPHLKNTGWNSHDSLSPDEMSILSAPCLKPLWRAATAAAPLSTDGTFV